MQDNKTVFSKVDSVKEVVEAYNYNSARDKAVFYSQQAYGATKENKDLAIDAVKQQGLQRIEETPGGKLLNEPDRYKLYDKQQAKEAWDEASSRFAKGAEGKASTYVIGADRDSTFFRVELKEILHNEKITEVNGLKRENLLEAYHQYENQQQGLNKAYAMVCEAELNQAYKEIAKAPLEKQEQLKKDICLEAREANHKAFLEKNRDNFQTQSKYAQAQAPPSPSEQHKNLISKYAPGTLRDSTISRPKETAKDKNHNKNRER